jgi:hypothetical protein
LASKAGTEEKAQYMILKGEELMIEETESNSLTNFVYITAKIDRQLQFIDMQAEALSNNSATEPTTKTPMPWTWTL